MAETTERIKTLVEQITDVKTQLSDLSRQEKDLREIRTNLEIELAEAMGDLDNITIKGLAHVRMEDERLPQVEDWDAFYDYIVSTRSPYLLQRRVSAKAITELDEQGTPVPGIDFFERRRAVVTKTRG